MAIDLRLGRYQDVLQDVTCNTVIVDAPYSAKTHDGHDGAAGVRAPSGWVKRDGTIDPSKVRNGIDCQAGRVGSWLHAQRRGSFSGGERWTVPTFCRPVLLNAGW